MTDKLQDQVEPILRLDDLSPAARKELVHLGVISPTGEMLPPRRVGHRSGFSGVEKRAITAPTVLNEAYSYAAPSSFSRGLRLDLKDYTYLFISGTASVDEEGRTVHAGDFRAQCWRTYRNISTLLESEGATWNDVVRATCYLRDIERDYKEFNEVRTAFFAWLGLDPLPASVGIQARLCREDLLVEIEALALLKRDE